MSKDWECRLFGLSLAVLGGGSSGYQLMTSSANVEIMIVGAALAMAVLILSVVYPSCFRTPVRYWIKLGVLMGHISNPILLGCIYVLTIMPCKLYFRLSRESLIEDSFVKTNRTYWVDRSNPNCSFEEQF